MNSTPDSRTIVLWCPDWPILALARSKRLDPALPLALIDRGRVFATSSAARGEGVRRGQRLREAQARCPDLQDFPYHPGLDARVFEPVIAMLEQVAPGVQLMRPGTCAIRARGAVRYYGGEQAAATVLLDTIAEQGVPARIGIADGPFAAEQAARASGRESLRIVAEGQSAAFIAPLPVSALVAPELAGLLGRLGIRTLGELAMLGEAEVLSRFGREGATARLLASGRDPATVRPRVPPKDLGRQLALEPGLDRVDQLAFAVRTTAEDVIAAVTAARIVATTIRIEFETEDGTRSERSWLHPRWFSAADIVDRVRWQLQGSGEGDAGLHSPVVSIRITPESTDAAGNHETGLWGSGPDERIHHGLARVQGMLGHEGVLTGARAGGRLLRDRQVLLPWGDRMVGLRPVERPWPGSMPDPLPATVFPAPRPVMVLDAARQTVSLDDRGMLVGEPTIFTDDGDSVGSRGVKAWAGPWPLRERWWERGFARELHRFQLVDEDDVAWLLVLRDGRWWAEARYD